METTSYTHYKVLYDIAREINSNLSVESVLKAIVETTTKAICAKGCALLLLQPDSNVLRHTVHYGLSDRYIKKGPIFFRSSSLKALKGNVEIITSVLEDPRVQYKDEARREGIESMVSVPLMLRNKAVGLLRIYTPQIVEYSEDDIKFLKAVANLGAIALEKARLLENLDKDLRKAREEQTRLEEQKRIFLRFLSIASHDLKAPLAAVQSYFNLMLGGFTGPLTDKQSTMIERSSCRINELLILVSDLLDVTKIETGMIVQEMEMVSFADVIEKSMEVVEALAKKKGTTIESMVPIKLPSVYASDARLIQAITNLMANAIKFTPPEGEITIKVKNREKDLAVEVADTGIGIPCSDLPFIFDDFFQGSNITEKGTGLGLSIVKRIIEAHGGNIFVESPRSDIGLGTKFTFHIPKGYRKQQRNKKAGDEK